MIVLAAILFRLPATSYQLTLLMFIVLEGIDGSGKTTQAKLLADEFRRNGKEVILTLEPTKTVVGAWIDAVLRGDVKLDMFALQYLFMADRLQHVAEVIRPALQRDAIVVCDRFHFSTIAYGRAFGMADELLMGIFAALPAIDHAILVDVSVDDALARVRSRGDVQHIFDKRDRLEKIRQQYLRLVDEGKLAAVDGRGSVEEVAERIRKIVNS